MNTKLTQLVASLGFAFASSALAQMMLPPSTAPYALSYSGRLTETSGKPVSGSVAIKIEFFRDDDTGAALNVTLPNKTVALQQGVFSVVIDLSPVDFHTVFNGTDPTWIQVTDVTNDKTYPRQLYNAVPYALKVPVDGMTIGWTADGQLEYIGGGGGGGGGPFDASDIASGVIDDARLPTAGAGTAGILSSADWNTFNNKQPAIAAGVGTQYWRGDKTFQTLDTSVVPENGANQYFTDARAKTATVANAIADNVTDVAPSQDAVYEQFQSLDTGVIPEDPSALYFTDARAKGAAVANTVLDNVTDVAPSQNAVFDQLALKQSLSGRNAANGYAGLNGGGTIDPAQMPYAGLSYRGVWDAGSNTPALPTPAACVTDGEYYIVTVGGATDLDGINTWAVGDWVICSGAGTWQRVGSSSGISTINGQTGSTITLDTDDVLDTTAVNKYYSDGLARAALSGSGAISYSSATGVIGITAATTGAAGSMSAADKTKLDAIATGADDVNTANVAGAGAVMDSDYTGNGILARNGVAGTYTLVTNNSTNWNTAYTDRLRWDGGDTDLVPATARTSLGLVIGTHVQGFDTTLSSIAALTPGANTMLYASGADSFSTTGLTLAGRALLDDADAATQRGTLGLDTMALQAASAVAITGGTITGVTLTTPTFANDAISGDKVHGGTISTFASTGIDDNAVGNVLTLNAGGQALIDGPASGPGLIVTGDGTVATHFNDGGIRIERSQANTAGNGSGSNFITMEQPDTTANNTAGLKWTTGGTTYSAIENIYIDRTAASEDSALTFTTMGAGSRAERMRIEEGGRVGIGTNAPSNLLTLGLSDTDTAVASSTAALAVFNPSTVNGNHAQIAFRTQDTAATQVVGAKIGAAFPTHGVGTTTGELVFATAPTSNSVAERMRITSAGNVGIGTTNPRTKLLVDEVSAGALTFPIVAANEGTAGVSTAGTAAAVAFRAQPASMGNGALKGALAYEYVAADSGFGKGSFHFLQNSASSTASATLADSVMTIKNNGNVGINTVSPAAKLDVDGDIVSRVHNLTASNTVDWANGNVQYTSSNAATINMSNIRDGGSYTLVITANAAPVMHAFAHAGLTFKFRPANAAPDANLDAVYSMIRAGNTVYVSWIKGW